MTHQPTQSPQFFLTAPSPCPYLEGEFERKVFTHLVGDKAPELNDLLTQGGFRRSQNIAYRPACERCRACVSIRIVVDAFRPTRSMKRVEERNRDLVARMSTASASSEQYVLFRRYLENIRDSGRRGGPGQSVSWRGPRPSVSASSDSRSPAFASCSSIAAWISGFSLTG